MFSSILWAHSVSEKRYECEDVIYNSSTSYRMISSPDYHSYRLYDNNLECTWTIVAESTKVVQLYIFEFELEKDQWCRFDKLKVYPIGVATCVIK